MAFVVMVCASLLAMDMWRAWSERREALRGAEVSSSNMAQALAHHADDTFKEADAVLFGLVERVQSDGVGPVALERLHALLEQLPPELPQIDGFYIYDQNARPLISSLPNAATPADYSDREYFRYHRSNDDHAVHIGVPVVSKRTGRWIIPLSRRLNHPDGSFAGVAVAAVSVDYFSQFYKRFNIGTQGAIVLAYNSGVMALRQPLLHNSIGLDISAAPTYRDYAARLFSGTVSLTSELDGVSRLNSFWHLERYPLFVNVALSRDEILASWRAATIGHALGVLALVSALALIGRRLIGQIKLRGAAETELAQAHRALGSVNRSLEQLAMQDSLTALANRRAFDIALDDAYRHALRHGGSLALIMFDIDYFKQYNDLNGHLAGDRCLRLIAGLIKDLGQRSPGDLVARYGGEEIGVLLPHTDAATARELAETIRREIRALAIAHTGSPYGVVTVSAGIDALHDPRRDSSAEQLIGRADRALYYAKSGGRDRIATAGEAEPAAAGDVAAAAAGRAADLPALPAGSGGEPPVPGAVVTAPLPP
jgi:diguanylate cyclase (GGDEF)-like protein